MDGTQFRDECAVAAVGMAQATLEDIRRLRKEPGPALFNSGDYSFLKHADEHTVVAIVAMLDALKRFPESTSFEHWAVVGAPRWPGRLVSDTAMSKFKTDGPRTVSALLIPNICLHALSGTVSLAFGMHGPNFGVGGGLGNVADGLLAGLVVQLEQRLPGTWVVLAEWDVEPQLPVTGEPPLARAVALALAPAESADGSPRLRLQPAAQPATSPAHPRLAGLADFLNNASAPQSAWSCTLDWGMELVLRGGESKA